MKVCIFFNDQQHEFNISNHNGNFGDFFDLFQAWAVTVLPMQKEDNIFELFKIYRVMSSDDVGNV